MFDLCEEPHRLAGRGCKGPGKDTAGREKDMGQPD